MKKFITSILSMAMLFGAVGCSGVKTEPNVYVTSKQSVGDDKKVMSKTDEWLNKEANLNWAPTVFVIHDKKIIGQTVGNEEGLVKRVKDIINNSKEELVINSKGDCITVDNAYYYFDSLFDDDKKVLLDVHMFGCPDCKHMDEAGYTKALRDSFPDYKYIRYYIKSDVHKVQEEYPNGVIK